MELNIETEQEEDGRWIAEVMDLPGVMVYGKTREDAIARVEVLARRVLEERQTSRQANFEKAAAYVMEKNAELYRRLS